MPIRPELQVFETLPVPVAVVRGDDIVLANQCLGAFFGVSTATLAGSSVRALLQRVVVPADLASWEMCANEPSWVRVLDAAGEERQVCLRPAPMPGRVDEQILLWLEYGEAPGRQPSDLLAGTAAELAHELRNPLGAILNAVALLKRATGKIPTAELLEMIEEEAERIDALVSGLLDLVQSLEPNVHQAEPDCDDFRTSSGSARSR